jgi:hypothetical protein
VLVEVLVERGLLMVRILSPLGQQQHGFSPLAPRPESLSGRKVGLLWNAKANGDLFLEEFRAMVEAQQADVDFEVFFKSNPNDAPDEDMTLRLRTCDVVITAVGD